MIGEEIALNKAKENAEWVLCRKCECGFATQKRHLNFCPNCGIMMHVTIDDDTLYGNPDYYTHLRDLKHEGFCEYCRPPVGRYQDEKYDKCMNCDKELDPAIYKVAYFKKSKEEKKK